MSRIYIIQRTPKTGEFADAVELILFTNKQRALKHYNKLKKDDQYYTEFTSRPCGGVMYFESANV